ncbi:MAG: DUF1569 domain-containing protein [Flavobacterium sp.]|uniref:DUF1569 domain-containing protein n=1 Tax=Flavobacterium sp. TaxID=239 RepID=UPI0022BBE361|nr:DUF1569 domain-containing protein [Flavobacterium sp.]MCZ8197892.1 DUF1569 domain-containing protein [Flavobacterium sp.]
MKTENIFTEAVAQKFTTRINNLSATTQPKWGKMDASQMMAHCNVSYEMALDENYKKSNGFIRFILKNLVKKGFVNEKPLAKNSSTAKEMLIKEVKNFDKEKKQLIENLHQFVSKGENYFDGKDHPGFGVMSKQEWNNFYYKHLDHHLTQFGV